MLTRSSVIIIIIVWLFCAVYGAVAKTFHYPYGNVALILAWVMSLLMLISIGIFIKKNKNKEQGK